MGSETSKKELKTIMRFKRDNLLDWALTYKRFKLSGNQRISINVRDSKTGKVTTVVSFADESFKSFKQKNFQSSAIISLDDYGRTLNKEDDSKQLFELGFYDAISITRQYNHKHLRKSDPQDHNIKVFNTTSGSQSLQIDLTKNSLPKEKQASPSQSSQQTISVVGESTRQSVEINSDSPNASKSQPLKSASLFVSSSSSDCPSQPSQWSQLPKSLAALISSSDSPIPPQTSSQTQAQAPLNSHPKSSNPTIFPNASKSPVSPGPASTTKKPPSASTPVTLPESTSKPIPPKAKASRKEAEGASASPAAAPVKKLLSASTVTTTTSTHPKPPATPAPAKESSSTSTVSNRTTHPKPTALVYSTETNVPSGSSVSAPVPTLTSNPATERLDTSSKSSSQKVVSTNAPTSKITSTTVPTSKTSAPATVASTVAQATKSQTTIVPSTTVASAKSSAKASTPASSVKTTIQPQISIPDTSKKAAETKPSSTQTQPSVTNSTKTSSLRKSSSAPVALTTSMSEKRTASAPLTGAPAKKKHQSTAVSVAESSTTKVSSSTTISKPTVSEPLASSKTQPLQQPSVMQSQPVPSSSAIAKNSFLSTFTGSDVEHAIPIEVDDEEPILSSIVKPAKQMGLTREKPDILEIDDALLSTRKKIDVTSSITYQFVIKGPTTKHFTLKSHETFQSIFEEYRESEKLDDRSLHFRFGNNLINSEATPQTLEAFDSRVNIINVVFTEPDKIAISLQDTEGKYPKMFVRVKRGAKLKKIFKAYRTKFNLLSAELVFLFDNLPVIGKMTTTDVGLETNANIMVRFVKKRV